MPIEAGSTNIEGLNVVLGPVPDLVGKVRVVDAINVALGNVRIILQGSEPGSAGGSAVAKPDGSFNLQNLAADSYNLSIFGLPEDSYIKSVRLGDADVTEKPLDWNPGAPGSLEITLASGSAQLTGTVLRDQQGAPGAIVVLVPDGERRKLARFYKTAITDQNGSFSIKSITPGDYRVFAWDELEEGAYMDPDFLQGFEAKGKTISLRPQARESVQLGVLSGAAENR
jgi:hypothetical protein